MPSKIKTGKLIDLFMADIAKYSAPGTVNNYRIYLSTLRYVALGEPVSKITDSFLREFIAKFYGQSASSTQHNAARCVCRLLNWAQAEGHIEKSPLRHFRKAPQTRRETYITAAEYAALLKAIPTSTLPDCVRLAKDVVRFLWHTGSRPQELRLIEAAWIAGDKIVLPLDKSKGKRKSRTILLNSQAKAIVKRLAQQYPTGPVFRNSDGNPWSKNTLGQFLSRLTKRVGLKKVCAYTFRHAYITRLLERGVDISTVAAIAGNSPEMIMGFYSHVGSNEKRLLGIVQGA